MTTRHCGAEPHGPARTSAGRRLVVCAWRNRPSLGAWALLLGIPGGIQAVVGWPWWQAAAVQWPLYAALWGAVTLADSRRLARGEQAGQAAEGGETS